MGYTGYLAHIVANDLGNVENVIAMVKELGLADVEQSLEDWTADLNDWLCK